ncbi:MAG: hypothetical protein QOC55_948, partial [Thermoleophilaceae bacterium]|nr:hypothetical protein [Thermoleophilaceae bacterium]
MTDPAAESQPIMLGDGTQHSRYRRFFTPVKQVSTQQLTYLTSVDDDEHEALAAVDPTTG